MPMYEYRCRDCEQPFEKKLRMSQSSDPQDCPVCASHNTRKLISSIAIAGINRTTTPAYSTPPLSSPFT